MPVEERQLLLAVRRVVGRVEVDRDAAHPPAQPAAMPLDDRRRQLAPQPIERNAPRTVLEPRDRRLRGQTRARHRVAPEQQLVNWVVGEPVRIVAVGMAAGDAEHPLADQVLERVPDLLRRPAVNQTPAERLDQPVDALGRLEQHGAAVRARLLAVERGHERLAEQIGEENRLCYRGVRHAGASVVAKRLVAQRLYHTEAPVSRRESNLHA